MLKGVLKTIEKYNMLNKGDRIVAAVSGGPDSMALLHILYTLKDKYNLYIHGAHLNHMLRGEEADQDCEYVKEFCRKRSIPLSIGFEDVELMAKKQGISLEEAGRVARYKLFDDVAKEIKASKIALAHNMNDQAETVFMRIMRGTGLDGLGGIKPVRDGIFIRPLLFTLREDIEKYCREHDINPRTDSTNLEPLYLRNKLRLQLIPYIRENYSSNIESLISSMAELLREDSEFLEEHVKNIYNEICTQNEGKVSINIDSLKEQHSSVKKRIIRKAIENVKGNLNAIESKHIELLLSIIHNGMTGAAVELPGGIKGIISYKLLNIIKYTGETNIKFRYEINIPGLTRIDETGDIMEAQTEEYKLSLHNEKDYLKYFDYDKIKENLVLRTREEGDFITPAGMKGTKKLKEFFIDQKIPRDIRDRIPVVAWGKEIIWVVGYRVSENYKITKKTENVLRLEFKQCRGR
ncbi:tRNA(Ile)-lysidine synthase [Oxobacter pfennigii]|uniref:tRNA(Ile)-lysidine synthase n=1 Tax=Oxobacter pfennigii TaxID=36849 RepID=A0A0N8NSR4_9CLOT|nr:tRNA lysidine(34) synthetase TilS [Oxobacter pfennigii]KPU42760.1 tRNA(Ile)-lysidine synthase [Oxobacter pfennigii]